MLHFQGHRVGVGETVWLLLLVWVCCLWIEAGAWSLRRILCYGGGAQCWDSARWNEKCFLLPLSCSWPSEHHQRVREAQNLHRSWHRDDGAQHITNIITKDRLMQSITWLTGLPLGATTRSSYKIDIFFHLQKSRHFTSHSLESAWVTARKQLVTGTKKSPHLVP